MNALLQEALQAFGLTRAEFIQLHKNAVYRADVWPREPWFAPRLTRCVKEQLQTIAKGSRF